MRIGEFMKRKVYSIADQARLEEAAALFLEHHIGTLPVIDAESRLIGILRLRDMITLAMPDFVRLLENIDFVHDFGAVERHRLTPQLLAQPVQQVMSAPVAVEENAGLLRALALLQEHQINDLPVVDHAYHLVGIASSVDIGLAILKSWNSEPAA